MQLRLEKDLRFAGLESLRKLKLAEGSSQNTTTHQTAHNLSSSLLLPVLHALVDGGRERSNIWLLSRDSLYIERPARHSQGIVRNTFGFRERAPLHTNDARRGYVDPWRNIFQHGKLQSLSNLSPDMTKRDVGNAGKDVAETMDVLLAASLQLQKRPRVARQVKLRERGSTLV